MSKKSTSKTYKNHYGKVKNIPNKPGIYNLKNRKGETVYTGTTNDLNRRIREHNRDPKKHFRSVSVQVTNKRIQANSAELKVLKSKKKN